MEEEMVINHMFSKIVGTTFVEGSQERLSKLEQTQELKLVEDVDNKFDPNAIAVYEGDFRLGYLPKETAKSVKEILKDNEISCRVSMVTGGNGNHYGCNLSLNW